MPPDSGAAFVLVQHLDPSHESLTADILRHSTAMPVVEVEDPTPVLPDLLAMLQDRDPVARASGAHALSRFGESALTKGKIRDFHHESLR